MAEQPTLSARQVAQVTRLTEVALQEYDARQNARIQQLQECAVAISIVKITEAKELNDALQQRCNNRWIARRKVAKRCVLDPG